jgi:hypothetical protein
MATARFNLGSAQATPSNTTALGFGGGPPDVSVTEEWNTSVNTFTPAAWAAGTSMGTARYGGNYFGASKTSQVAASGHIPGSPDITANSETYDGTTWTEGSNLGTARFNGYGGGTETAGLVVGGRDPSSAPAPQVYLSETEEYDGSSWSEVTNTPQAAYRRCGAGTQTSTIILGGLIGPAPSPSIATTSSEYDGTNWTAGGAAPFQGNYMDGVGNVTAAVVFGDQQNPPNASKSYDYDGTSWTANNDMNLMHAGQHVAAGTTTVALVAGGGAPYAISATGEAYDGTTFSTGATLGTSGQRGGKSSTVAAAIAAGGYGGGPGSQFLSSTEEYSEATTAINPKTLTTG